jgi:hypothetical protein
MGKETLPLKNGKRPTGAKIRINALSLSYRRKPVSIHKELPVVLRD